MFDRDGLRAQIASGKRLVIFLHDNPDPDAIAAGWLLSRVAESVGRKAVIVYGGRLGRAENRTMVKLLKIPLRHLDKTRLRFLKTDRYAVVDTQPGAGNNSFPDDQLACHIVVDHHPPRRRLTAQFVDIRSEHGCSTTMVLDYLTGCGLGLDPDLATAIAYAIASETQDLKREATRADREAYQLAFASARLTVLGRIRHPDRTREYYRTIARAMGKVMLARNTCVCHIGAVDEAEVVAEVADFLACMERVTWCLVSGLHQSQMVLSMRSTLPRAEAEKVIRKSLGRLGKGGGHGMIAGGMMPVASPEDYLVQAELLTDRFLTLLQRRQTSNLRPLLADPE
jgi:nanoRNase/pAp phosphatase (c-di-AMP/oligoRNAs hydrolase)